MASVQARHTRRCALGKPWTPFDRERLADCTCRPTFYVVVREGTKLQRERVGKDRQNAERALRKIGAQVDEGSYLAPKIITFKAWGEQWTASLERKASTISSYETTVRLASEVFGSKRVRELRPEDVARFNQSLRERVSPATRGKHLRVLGACLASAVIHGYAGDNPVRRLPKAERPRQHMREAAYFTDAELLLLIPKLEGVYRVLVQVAVQTGARLGELGALRWGDLDLVGKVMHIRRTVSDDGTIHEPKNFEKREIDLTDSLVECLGAWWGELAGPDDDRLVFPGDGKHGYLDGTAVLRRELYPAMKAADIDREGPGGVKRTFHSLRHTHARIALESGCDPFWLSRRLGHHSPSFTLTRYGHWSRSAARKQAEILAGAFGQ